MKSIAELAEEYREQLERLWDEEVATTDFELPFDHYVTMSEPAHGRRYPILVGMHDNGIADGEVINNSLFEEAVSEGGLDFDIDVPEAVIEEIERINGELLEY